MGTTHQIVELGRIGDVRKYGFRDSFTDCDGHVSKLRLSMWDRKSQGAGLIVTGHGNCAISVGPHQNIFMKPSASSWLHPPHRSS